MNFLDNQKLLPLCSIVSNHVPDSISSSLTLIFKLSRMKLRTVESSIMKPSDTEPDNVIFSILPFSSTLSNVPFNLTDLTRPFSSNKPGLLSGFAFISGLRYKFAYLKNSGLICVLAGKNTYFPGFESIPTRTL